MSELEHTADPYVGTLVAKRYRLGRRIGEGNFSYVYRAYDEKAQNKTYAVKILKPKEMEDKDTIQRFQREIQLTQQLEHPNIIRIFSSGFLDSGSLYLTTEYLKDGDLLRELEAKNGDPLELLRAINLIRFLALGIAHAHKRKVLHRDIKPENILLTAANGIKISDFGIGLSLRFTRQTEKNLTIGTPCYMAPEQIEGGELGPWTDVYAMGILSYQLLTGKLPFESPRISEIIYKQCHCPTPSLLFKGGGIPCWMEDIVHRACDKEPARRFQDAGEMLQEVDTRFYQEVASYSLSRKLVYFFRPSGKACTFFTERGVPRKRLGYYLFAIVGTLALAISILFLSKISSSST